MINISDNKKAILDAAESIFAKKGAKASTLADIARKANISKGTLYYYYTTKKELITDVADRHLNKISDSLKSFTSSLKSKTDVRKSLRTLFEKVKMQPDFSSIQICIMSEAATNKSIMNKIKEKNSEWLFEIEHTLETFYKDNAEICKGIAAMILALIYSSTVLNAGNIEDISHNMEKLIRIGGSNI